MTDMIKASPLFKGANASTIEMVQRLGCVKRFQAGDAVWDGQHLAIGIMLQGIAKIIKHSADNHDVIMHRILPPQMFGAAQVFRGGRELSRVVAEQDCSVLFIGRDIVEKAVKEDFTVGLNYIAFLSERIYFLNRKIEGFTGYSARSRLSMYLLDHAQMKDGVYIVQLHHSLKELADVINVGRASLYRAMDTLVEEGIITRDRRRITILDITALYAD